jgi:hypothetical protein
MVGGWDVLVVISIDGLVVGDTVAASHGEVGQSGKRDDESSEDVVETLRLWWVSLWKRCLSKFASLTIWVFQARPEKDGDRVERHPHRNGRGEGLNKIKSHGGSAVLWVTDWVSGQMFNRAKLKCEGKQESMMNDRRKVGLCATGGGGWGGAVAHMSRWQGRRTTGWFASPVHSVIVHRFSLPEGGGK